MYINNNGYAHVCRHCTEELFNHYMTVTESEYEAIRRLCMRFDLYYSDSIVVSAKKSASERGWMSAYIKLLNLSQNRSKTYDDTIDEESTDIINSIDGLRDKKSIKITQKTVKFWGPGFSDEDYHYLNDKYDEWTTRHECKTKAQESIFQKICLLELQITKATQNGDKVEGLINSYNSLLGSANVKPVQNNDNTFADENTFGTLIQKWENEKPIPEPDEEWKDVDSIRRYVSIWFLGHLCKMMGVDNSWSRLYVEELSKYTVEAPNYVEDDVSSEFDTLFDGDEPSE